MVLIAGATAARLAYLLWLCPYTLAEDEAHYWEWARRLDWSYYSKGPGVAWAIAASEGFFRGLGVPLNEGTVRAPAAVFGGVLAACAAGLTREVTRDNRAAFVAALLVLLTPALQIASTMMTIDIPYVALWAGAAWMGWKALEGGSRGAWVGLGAAVAAGFLFKYTMLLIVPGLVLYALVRRGRLGLAPGWKPWALGGLVVAGLGMLPVVVWNAQHGWPTVRHLLGHMRVSGGDVAPPRGGWKYNPRWMAQYVLVQPLVMLPASLLMIEGLGRAWKRRREEPLPAGLYLVLLGAPVLVFYLLVSVAAEVEGNWAMAAYVTLFPAAGWYVVRAYDERRGSGRFTAMASWRFALIGGLAAAVLMLRIDLVAGSGPVRWAEGALRSAGVLKEDQRMIPVGRVLGAEVVAASAAALGERVREETGREPFYIATIYGRASQLAYYLPGRPPVYCTGERTGGRKTQFDFWPDHDLDDPGLLGRPAVLVGGEKYQWEPAFAGVREAGMLRGETKKGRIAFVGIGYRGWGGRVVP